MIAWFAKNSVAANLLMISIIIGGVMSLRDGLRLEIFPSSEPNTVSVSVPLRGATPEDVELGVAVRIEDAIQDLEGIDRVTSRSVEGSTRVSIEIDSSYDAREVLDDIKSRVDAINTFPAETEKPIISLSVRSFPVISVVVAGDYSEDEIRILAEHARDDLLRIDGITQAQLSSVSNYEIAIEASPDRLREFNVTLADLARAIQASSVDLSAGNVRTDGGDVLIRSKGQAYRRTDFEQIVVKTNSDGSIVRVNDIAIVLDGFEELKICVNYELDGKVIDHLPIAADEQARCKPIYETMPGWSESTEGARSWAELPAEAIKYVRRVEELIDCPVAMLSTSPEREDTILVTDPFAD